MSALFSLWFLSFCGIVTGLSRSECAGEIGLCGGVFWDRFVLDSPSDWSPFFCSADLLFPVSICIVLSSIDLVALFVSPRILGSKIRFNSEFVLSSDSYLTAVSLSIL